LIRKISKGIEDERTHSAGFGLSERTINSQLGKRVEDAQLE